MKHSELGKNKVLFQRLTVINGRFYFLLRMYLGLGEGMAITRYPRLVVNPIRKNLIVCFYE